MENFRDAELKKWLAEEYEKETEEMEKILFPDGVIPDDGETEEEAKAAYQRLVEKLKADIELVKQKIKVIDDSIRSAE